MTFRGKGQGLNPLIPNILKTVTDMRLEPREHFFKSHHGLLTGTVRLDLVVSVGCPLASVWMTLRGMLKVSGRFRSHSQQQPGRFAKNHPCLT